MRVSRDFVCEHGLPQPWVTCVDCMSLSPDERPEPPVDPPTPAAAKATKPAAAKKPRRPSAPPVGRLPRSETDALPALVGDKDLAYEIPPGDLGYFVGGSESNWLPISRMPRELRPAGHVYLQCDTALVARARVRGIGFRDRRWAHAAPDVATDLGPGATLEVDGSWDLVSVDLGPDGDCAVIDYRYLVTLLDGSVSVATTDPEP